MKRRDLLAFATLAPMGLAVRPACASQDWRTYDVVTRVEVHDPAGPTRVWLPVPLREAGDYQRVAAMRWDAPGAQARLVDVAGYDVRALAVEWPSKPGRAEVTLSARVRTRDRRASPDSPAVQRVGPSGDALQRYLRPTRLLPTDGIVADTARRITAGRRDDVDKARAIYEWVVENTNRDAKIPGCGVGDVASLLESGHLDGKCADINALFVALARASGIPARDAYGVRIAASRLGYHCLGRDGDVSKAQHCRAEFHARDRGWIPVDPADVRKLVLEEDGGMPLESAKVRGAREAMFGGWEMNWIAYNHGHDVILPGADGRPLPFLMYPQGRTGERHLDSLDPLSFAYRITSTEIA
jgi:transglutaminase-like putative cysteine protease